jgi:hypothetical protein
MGSRFQRELVEAEPDWVSTTTRIGSETLLATGGPVPVNPTELAWGKICQLEPVDAGIRIPPHRS